MNKLSKKQPMYNQFIHTFLIKILSAIIQFLTIVLLSRSLGVDGRGLQSIILSNIALLVLFNEFIGGTSYVYLSSRIPAFHLLLLGYIWSLVSSSLFTLPITYLSEMPPRFAIHIFFISISQSIFSIHSYILLGEKKIKVYNYLSLCRLVLLLVVLYTFFQYRHLSVYAYIWSMYIASITSGVISFKWVYPYISPINLPFLLTHLIRIIKYGAYTQIGNILQFLNYRLSYYLLWRLEDSASVGIYANAINIAESIWILSRSASTVQYAHISNTKKMETAVRLTYKLLIYVSILLIISVLLICFVPSEIYVFLFGIDFGQIKPLLNYLSVGVIALGVVSILSHFFSGIGAFYINTASSAISLAIGSICAVILIQKWGIIGAAISSSISYSIALLFNLIIFLKKYPNRIWKKDIKRDIIAVRQYIKN